MGLGIDRRESRGRSECRAVHDGGISHRREPRRSQFDHGGSRMNRSRKDITLMFTMGALLLFAVFNFVFKPQRNDLASARSDLQQVEQSLGRGVDAAGAGGHHTRSTSGVCVGGSARSRGRHAAPATELSRGRHRCDTRRDLAYPARRESNWPWRIVAGLDHRVGSPCCRSRIRRAAARHGAPDRRGEDRDRQPARNWRVRAGRSGPVARCGFPRCNHQRPCRPMCPHRHRHEMSSRWGNPMRTSVHPADTRIRQPHVPEVHNEQLPHTSAGRDKGFTLIELMVVVLIIAIFLAIAIPTFLGAQNKAKDRSAQSSSRNALTNAKTIYADSATYAAATPTALLASEPSLTFQPGVSTGPKNVSVALDRYNAWFGAVMSDTGTCFYISDVVGPTGSAGTKYASDSSAGAAAACTGTVASGFPPTRSSGEFVTLGGDSVSSSSRRPEKVRADTSGRDDRRLGARCARPTGRASPRFAAAWARNGTTASGIAPKEHGWAAKVGSRDSGIAPKQVRRWRSSRRTRRSSRARRPSG